MLLRRFFVLILYLVIYAGGFTFLQYYLRNHPPKMSSERVLSGARPARVLFWWVIPALPPLIWIVWWQTLRTSAVTLLFLVLFVPVLIYLAFFIWANVFKPLVSLTYMMVTFLILLLPGLLLLLMEISPILRLLFIVNLIIPPVLTLLWLILWTPEILPLDPAQGRNLRQVISYLIGFFTAYPKPSIFMTNGEEQVHIKGHASRGSGPGLIVVEPQNVVAIKDGSAIRGFRGPGAAFMEQHEKVEAVIDLREQWRGTKVEALTRDGIGVEAQVSSSFRINSGGAPLALEHPWPYRMSDAYKALFAAEVNPEGKTPLDAHHACPWEELPLTVATHQARQALAKYSLDELYRPSMTAPMTLPHVDLGKQVRAQVEKDMAEKGIQVTGGGIGQIQPADEDVLKQRIETWKAQWIQRVMENAGQAAADRITQLGRIRVDALNDLLQGAIYQSDELQKSGDNVATSLDSLLILETLEYIASDPKVEPMLPESALPILQGLQLQLAEPKEEDKNTLAAALASSFRLLQLAEPKEEDKNEGKKKDE